MKNKIHKTKITKDIRRYRRLVTKINKLKTITKKLKDSDFRKKTVLFKRKLKNGEKIENILIEAYALVKEVIFRKLKIDIYNVQLQGAIAVHEEKIAEMKTGEGKTLTIVFPAYLHALTGEGVHIITANDYLAQRDATDMGKIYELLGLSVGYIISNTNLFDRQVIYRSDIVYTTNNEIGFDFLRDNMLYEFSNRRQRELNFAIIDEADSVLIDEAQTPLVISNDKEYSSSVQQIYLKINPVVSQLQRQVDYKVNIKKQTAELTLAGVKKIEKVLGVHNLYEESDIDYIYYVTRLLKAYALFKRDRDYIIDNGEVVIVDEFTGRLMYNHRYYQGIHQAIEAKEGLAIKPENKVLASITLQHLFKKYNKIAGLTGTAWTARKEFKLLYNKKVVVIPTNKMIKRVDKPDRFFLSWEDKMQYLTWLIQERYFKKGAVLVGARSIKKSEDVYKHLLEINIPAQVLNAQHTKREAKVISQAGQPQAVTVATNMAGRGTDIKLDKSVQMKGGLFMIGTERHNARRIDNQLVGRAGRQGDPGQSQFLISADDILIKTYFKNQYLSNIKRFSNINKGVESRKMQKISDRAQERMEHILFDQRVLTYEFDKVLDKQRQSFYRQRERVLLDNNLKEETLGLINKEIYRLMLAKYKFGSKIYTEIQIRDIIAEIEVLVENRFFKMMLSEDIKEYFKNVLQTKVGIKDVIYETISEYYNFLEKTLGRKKMRITEKTVTLKVLDLLWVRHLEQVNQIQEAALVLSISQGGFFEEYELRMSKMYQQMLLSIPKIVSLTFFRTINKLIKNKDI